MEDSLFLKKLKFFGLLQTISPDEQTSLMESLFKNVSASTSKAQFAKILDVCQKTCPSKPLKDGIQTFMNINKTLEDLNNTSTTSADALADDKMRCCLHMMNYITTHGQGYTSSNRATIDKKIEILIALISFVEQSTSLVDIQNGIQGIIDNNKEVTRKGFFSFLNPGPGKYQQCLNAALESISHSVRNARTDPFGISC
jgi:hypothetical protein